MSHKNVSDAESTERNERREAEIEFVNCAYTPEEAQSSSDGIITRSLKLDVENNDDILITINLQMSMPSLYPDLSPLEINKATVISSHPSSPMTKFAMNSTPQLIQACRSVAKEHLGEESVLSVFLCAESWIQNEWIELLQKNPSSLQQSKKNKSPILEPISSTSTRTKNQSKQSLPLKLGRRAMYSHHIININKRKMILNLATEYQLGGYMKIGWPGIILIEGLEQNCIQFWNEIRTSKWQYITVRYEESEHMENEEALNAKRCFGWPCRFQELGKKDMSVLAQYCRDAGLEYLFLSCLKIPNTGSAAIENDIDDNNLSMGGMELPSKYGILIHVDHMNDDKRYCKWLHRSAQDSNCSIWIKMSSHRMSDKVSQNLEAEESIKHSSISRKQIIVVALVGEKVAVKQFMKKWRTSRVDVDSKGKPCLERKMYVLCEGDLNVSGTHTTLDNFVSKDDSLFMDLTSLTHELERMGGDPWRKSFEDKFIE